MLKLHSPKIDLELSRIVRSQSLISHHNQVSLECYVAMIQSCMTQLNAHQSANQASSLTHRAITSLEIRMSRTLSGIA